MVIIQRNQIKQRQNDVTRATYNKNYFVGVENWSIRHNPGRVCLDNPTSIVHSPLTTTSLKLQVNTRF